MREPERPDLGAFRPGFARAVSDWIVCRGSARAGLSRPRVAGASPRSARSGVLPCVPDFCPFWRRRGGAASSRAALVEPVPLGSDALSVLTLRQGRTCRVVVGVGGAGSHQWQLPAPSNTTSSKAVESSCWSRRRLGVAPFPLPRSLRRRTLAARNGSPAHALSSVSGRLRRSAGRGGFSVVGEQRAKFGPRGPHGPPETAVRVDLPPWRAAFPASYAAISTCRRLTFNARHTKSHSQRTFASPRKLKRRKPSACLIQP